MDSKAQLTVDVISKVTQSRMSVINAAKLLNKSSRTIEPYPQRYQQVGIQFIIHRNSGKVPVNKTPDCLKRQCNPHNNLSTILTNSSIRLVHFIPKSRAFCL